MQYTSGLSRVEIAPPQEAAGAQSVWHLYVIQVSARDELRTFLDSRGIESGIHYPVPVHLQPAFSGLGHARGSFPVTEGVSDRIVSLPMYPELSADAVELVVSAIEDFMTRHSSPAVA